MVTAKDIINAYFGGEKYVPKKLSEYGMECCDMMEEQSLAEKMEIYYCDEYESVEDHEEAMVIHREILRWIHEHNDEHKLTEQDIKALAELREKFNDDREISIPVSLAKEICRYCEYESIYDKLANFGDFYYVLKRLIEWKTR